MVEQKNPYVNEPLVQEYRDTRFTYKNILNAQSQMKSKADENGFLCAYEQLKTGADKEYDSKGIFSKARQRAKIKLEQISEEIDNLVQSTGADLEKLGKEPVVQNFREYNHKNKMCGSIEFLLFGSLATISGLATKYILRKFTGDK